MKIKFKLVALILFLVTSLLADSPRLLGQKAPSFGNIKWVQSFKDNLDISDLKGKVVYIATFQDVCPYCHQVGLPALQELSEHYAGDAGVQFIGIQTAFEDEEENDLASISTVIKDYNLKIPIGNSPRDEYSRPLFMDTYRTGGTPWVIIIDKDGIIQYSDFQIHLDLAMAMISRFKRDLE